MQAFSLGAQFARESAMLKLPEERGKWGESKGAGRGRGESIFFLPSPSPLSFFPPRTYRKGYHFYSPQSSTVIKSKMAATTILRTRTRFPPPKIRLHCRLTSFAKSVGVSSTEQLYTSLDSANVLTIAIRPRIDKRRPNQRFNTFIILISRSSKLIFSPTCFS